MGIVSKVVLGIVVLAVVVFVGVTAEGPAQGKAPCAAVSVAIEGLPGAGRTRRSGFRRPWSSWLS